MLLRNTLYRTGDFDGDVAGFAATISLDASHIVYKGHFPGFPVTPGVIQMQIVHELLEDYLGKKLKLVSMPQCKFLQVINPEETTQLIIEVKLQSQNAVIQVKASGRWKERIYFRMHSRYSAV